MNIHDVAFKDVRHGEKAGQASSPRKQSGAIRKRFRHESVKEQLDAEQAAASSSLAHTKRPIESDYNLRNKSVKQLPSSHPKTRNSRTKREAEPLFECTRDEAMQIGSQIHQALMLKAIHDHQCQHSHMDADDLEEIAHDELEGVVESDGEDNENDDIVDIARNRSEYVASQLATLYELCDAQSRQHSAAVQKLQRFALALAQQLPERTVSEEAAIDENAPIDPEFLGLAAKMAKALPFELDDQAIAKLARQLQAKAETINDSADAGHAEETKKLDISLQEKQIGRIIGNLMLIAQDNVVQAAKLVSSRNLEESSRNIFEASAAVIAKAKERVNHHAGLHQASALQHIELSHFQKMTVEMASVLMLKNGYFNVGLIDDVLAALVPQQFQDTLIVQNMKHILDQLRQDPLLWLLISEVEPPKSPTLPSNDLIRATLGLSPQEPITKLHAQITLLSAVLRPIRQANAGTCFATAWLIKTIYHDIRSCIEDYSEALQHGETKRLIHHEYRTFPFQARTTNEALGTILEAAPDGTILRKTRFEATLYEQLHKDDRPVPGAKLYDAPGILNACQALNIGNPAEAVIHAVAGFAGKSFNIEQLLIELAKYAEAKQKSMRYRLRSQSEFTLQELIDKALYAFAAQANHPLHRAWEQMTASMVGYFGSQYSFPHWTHETLTEVMKRISKPEGGSYKRMQKTLLSEMFLPMISRMRYRYNHYFPETKKLFNTMEYGGNENHFYGYELCDTGLPADFEYSRRLHNQMQQATSMMHLERFREYASPHTWKVVDSAEKFQDFILNVMTETIEHIKRENKTAHTPEEWDLFAARFSKKVKTERFTRLMIEKILGPGDRQRKKLKRNEYTMTTLPWRYKWGGDPNEVVKTYFNFKEMPSNELLFSGSPKEVLAWQLNYLKKQPDHLKEQFKQPYTSLTPLSSPVHAFLLRPFDPTVLKAIESDLSVNDYIEHFVEAPGRQVAEHVLSRASRAEIIDFVANNMWVARDREKHDLDRQELTEESKLIFDTKIAEQDVSNMTFAEFKDFVYKSVICSRAADLKIGKRYRHWEEHFKTALKNKIQQLAPDADDNAPLPLAAARSIIDFARNRKDTLALSDESLNKFKLRARRIPQSLTIQEFRKAIVDIASDIREEEVGTKDKHWLGSFKPNLDTKLFTVLPDDQKQKLLKASVVSSDTNWKDGIHDLHFIFLVNPGSGEIEMVDFNPDSQSLRFRNLSSWFPKKKRGRWELPDNYRSYPGEPVLNAEKYLNIH